MVSISFFIVNNKTEQLSAICHSGHEKGHHRKIYLQVDDGTGSPWTVVNASKNPTSTKWLKDKDGSFAADERFYVLVLAEPVVLRDSNSKVSNIYKV